MSVKCELGCFRKNVAIDELLDAVDVLNGKLSQCIEVGFSKDEIQRTLDEYHMCHVHDPLIRVLK